ncbi:GNAT family N-acetyltransferase, partial [Exiguobacterium sp. B2(2022)]|uniref:GNAT family N-acetyltransferase n=1 Tax=Exiguobacterium sp. B2(2022) TaxID=2992755 RepID=UPI00237AA82F
FCFIETFSLLFRTKYEKEGIVLYIRLATLKDISRITEVSTASFRQEADTLQLPVRDLNVEPPGYDNEPMTHYLIEELTTYVTEQDGKLVGGIVLTLTGGDYARIDRVFVHPDVQGQGIGKALIQYVEAEYPHVRIWELETSTHQKRNIRFYKQLGFQVVYESDDEVCFVKRTKAKPSTHCFEERSCEGWQAYGVNASHLAVTNSNIFLFDASNCNFSQSRFRNINFRDSKFSDLNLSGSQFNFVTMQENERTIQMHHSNLRGATFNQCDLTNVTLTGCDIKGMKINGISIDTLISTKRGEM